MRWTTTKLMAAGSLGVLRLILSLPGAALPVILAVPGASGLLNVFVAGILFPLTCLTIRTFGAATITGFVFSFLALPLPLSGPPGFVPKLIIGITSGLVADGIFALLRAKERLSALLIGGITNIVIGLEIAGLGMVWQVPGIERFIKVMVSPITLGGALIGGAIAGYLGWLIYNRLKHSPVVRKIQSV